MGKGASIKPPKAPPPPAPTDAAANKALRERMERLRRARGYESTFLTRNATSPPPLGEPSTLLNRLLGG